MACLFERLCRDGVLEEAFCVLANRERLAPLTKMRNCVCVRAELLPIPNNSELIQDHRFWPNNREKNRFFTIENRF